MVRAGLLRVELYPFVLFCFLVLRGTVVVAFCMLHYSLEASATVGGSRRITRGVLVWVASQHVTIQNSGSICCYGYNTLKLRCTLIDCHPFCLVWWLSYCTGRFSSQNETQAGPAAYHTWCVFDDLFSLLSRKVSRLVAPDPPPAFAALDCCRACHVSRGAGWERMAFTPAPPTPW